MDIWYYVMTPFTWLLTVLYRAFNSYGVALILFALVVKVILFPLSLKGKRSMIQMNLLSGKMQKLQKQYGKDQQRYQLEVQKLYEKENVNPMGGCLWSMIPLFILLPLYAIIRQPLKYMMGLTPDQIGAVANSLNWASAAVGHGWIKEAADFANVGYNQMYLASLITPENLSAVQAAAGETLKAIFPINFSFLGVNMALIPKLKFWVDGLMGFGLFLVPVVSAATSVLFSVIMQKTNSMNGQQNAQANSTNKAMMLVTPLMSLWIGFSMPASLSVYWIANNVFGLGQEIICGRMLKKDYEAAAEEAKRREEEEKEEEKRLRREKAEQRAREAEEARKNKGKKKKEDADAEKMSPQQREASREGIRQYARGRAYDPARFGGVTPYFDPSSGKVVEAAKLNAAAEKAPAADEDTTPEETAVETAAPETVAPETAVETAAPEEAAADEDTTPEDPSANA